MTKEKMELMIDNALMALDDSEKVKKASENCLEYNKLFYVTDEEGYPIYILDDNGQPEYGEGFIANAVSEYPELHPKMIAIVDKIIATTSLDMVGPLWESDETLAGNRLAHALAMYDKKYCYIYANSLLSQEWGQEYERDKIAGLVCKWEFCEEVMRVLEVLEE